MDTVDIHVVDFLYRHFESVEHKDRHVGVSQKVGAPFQRLAVGIELLALDVRCAADVDFVDVVGVRTKSATVDNTERRVECLQSLHGILYVYLPQLVASHHRGRTRKTVFLQFLKPCNHHLVQLVGIVF